jgi:hypothetical protein
MANAVDARFQGDDYQARYFWLQVVRLFRPNTRVTRVGWEVDNASGFDDVVAYYDGGQGDGDDPCVAADYFQIKFHVTYQPAFTAAALIDPGFIGGSSRSLLKRLLDLQRKAAPTGKEARFTIVAPTSIDPNDTLAKLVTCDDGALRVDRLRSGKTIASEMGSIREMWRSHLGLASDEELFTALGALRIRTDFPSLAGLREELNLRLPTVGMKPHSEGRLGTIYDDLPKKLFRRGENIFDRTSIESLIAREDLKLEMDPAMSPRARQIGIRSFLPWAERMEDETEAILSLVPYFENRAIRNNELWNTALLPELEKWLKDNLVGSRSVDLHLDTHASIAFATGWFVNNKSGVSVSPMQRTRAGKVLWCPGESEPCADAELWVNNTERIRDGSPDIAVIFSITHDAHSEARRYISEEVPSVGVVIELTPCVGIGPGCIRNADHALKLAEAAVNEVGRVLKTLSRSARVNVFAAAPNGFMFFLGQSAPVWGRCRLYEHDFSRSSMSPYSPSLELTNH